MPYLIISLIIAVIAVIFALQNADPVSVTVLTAQYESSLALVLILTIILGILMGILVLTPRLIKNKVAISQKEKRIRELEKALSAEAESKALPESTDDQASITGSAASEASPSE